MRLVVVVKEPLPGQVKTRLGAEIGHPLAAELAGAFVDDTLFRLGEAVDHLVVCHAPALISQGFRERCLLQAPGCTFLPQVSGGLGERLAVALEGPGIRLAVGTDAPDLPLAVIEEALAALRGDRDVVASPARDGGFTLLGLAEGVDPSPLANSIRWSHAETWADTSAAFGSARVGEVAAWDDVDRLVDLKALLKRLKRGACPATEAWALANGYLDRYDPLC